MNASARTRPKILAALAAVMGVSALFGVAYVHQGRVDREVRTLPERESRALSQRTLETLRTSCAEVTGPNSSEHCRQQAEIIERFPFCDRACRELAQTFAARPTR
jgi:cytochrome b pre-mRNA-processing protein 3